MAALRGNVFLNNHGKLKSVAIGGKPARYVIRPKGKNASTRAIYARECSNHDRPHLTVPVDLFVYDPETKLSTDIGTARACPLCWKILEQPA